MNYLFIIGLSAVMLILGKVLLKFNKKQTAIFFVTFGAFIFMTTALVGMYTLGNDLFYNLIH